MAGETQVHTNNATTTTPNCVNGNGVQHGQNEEKKNSSSIDWNYDESDTKCGPKGWLSGFGASNCGHLQSPIEIHLNKTPKIPISECPFRLVNYRKSLVGEVVNTGKSVQFSPNAEVEPAEISGGMLDQSYRFVQYHFHWAQNDNEGSEHVIDGVRYSAELHLVHKGVKDPSKLAVLGVFLKTVNSEDKAQDCPTIFSVDELRAFRTALKYPQKASVPMAGALIDKLPRCNVLPKINGMIDDTFAVPFVRYEGSLTTPPCSENVTWTVFLDPIYVTKEQMNILRSVEDNCGHIIQKNYRPVQEINGRKIFLASN